MQEAATDGEEGRFVAAPWYDRIFAVVCIPFWIVLMVHSISADISDGEEFLSRLGGLVSMCVFIHLRSYIKRDAPVRTLIFGGILTAGILTALIWACLPMALALDFRNASKGGTILLTAFGVLVVWVYFMDMLTTLGVSKRDLVAEQRVREERLRRQPRKGPERNCVDCGMTLRVGRPRCHFCGGLPAQNAQLV